MLYPTYKGIVRHNITLWLMTECDGEPINEIFLEKVAKYGYANEYPVGDAQETVLYDFLRLTEGTVV